MNGWIFSVLFWCLKIILSSESVFIKHTASSPKMRIFIISNLILMTERKPPVNNLVLGQMSPGGSELDLSSQELAAQWWEDSDSSEQYWKSHCLCFLISPYLAFLLLACKYTKEVLKQWYDLLHFFVLNWIINGSEIWTFRSCST